MRTRSNVADRREAITDHVHKHPKIRLLDVVDWAVREGMGSSSTVYADIKALFNRRELIRIPGEHGDILALPENVSFADPETVRERASRALDATKSWELRGAALADLVRLADTHDILPDREILDLLLVAVQDRQLPGRDLALRLLRRIATQCDAPPSSGRDDVDRGVIREKLRRKLRGPLLDAVGEDLAQAEWAADVLATLSKGEGEKDAAMALLRSALDRRHPMPTFQAVLVAVVKGVATLMASAPEPALLRRDIRLELDRALDSPTRDDRERARQLSNELRSLLFGA